MKNENMLTRRKWEEGGAQDGRCTVWEEAVHMMGSARDGRGGGGARDGRCT